MLKSIKNVLALVLLLVMSTLIPVKASPVKELSKISAVSAAESVKFLFVASDLSVSKTAVNLFLGTGAILTKEVKIYKPSGFISVLKNDAKPDNTIINGILNSRYRYVQVDVQSITA